MKSPNLTQCGLIFEMLARSSVAEHPLDTGKVVGSTPIAPTISNTYLNSQVRNLHSELGEFR
jgi:hypothetical protein